MNLPSLISRVKRFFTAITYNVKLFFGLVRSWLWFFANDIDNPNLFYCTHIKERIMCTHCPHHIMNKTDKYIEWYCDLAHKKLKEECK